MEAESVLRSRYEGDVASMTAAVIAMLETPGIEFEDGPGREQAIREVGRWVLPHQPAYFSRRPVAQVATGPAPDVSGTQTSPNGENIKRSFQTFV